MGVTVGPPWMRARYARVGWIHGLMSADFTARDQR